MTAFVALVRAVNVGGTGKLPMAALKAACMAAGFTSVRTYLASGNAVFQADGDEAAVRTSLDAALRPVLGAKTGILVRSAAALADVLAGSPFPGAPGNRTAVIFLDAEPSTDAMHGVTGRTDEEIRLVGRHIHVHYPSGMGTSRLKIPAAAAGTARNMNTVAALAAMAAVL